MVNLETDIQNFLCCFFKFIIFFTFMGPCILLRYSRITNKMQRYTVVFTRVGTLIVVTIYLQLIQN